MHRRSLPPSLPLSSSSLSFLPIHIECGGGGGGGGGVCSAGLYGNPPAAPHDRDRRNGIQLPDWKEYWQRRRGGAAAELILRAMTELCYSHRRTRTTNDDDVGVNISRGSRIARYDLLYPAAAAE